ncbi:MAG: hypothetical protein CMK97_12015 [Pseudomonas sp.]|nr:hypothetical protein [Pseudomonas sp.]MBB51176.1 hypothetical protein [Pseudomonadales bacterium]|tara:strand:- start:5697 stop:6284 length:588 start_codon:yes stop_codon:yes gene_type:complete
MKKLLSYQFMTEPATPPRRLRRWFVEFDQYGQALTVLLLSLAAIGYSQISGLADGIVMAVLGRFWALWVLTVLITYLLALDLTAEIYERTTGAAYRRRERELRGIAASAERDAVSAAEAAVRVRTRQLDEREAALADMQNRLRIESSELHEQRLLLATKSREFKSRDQAVCSGSKRRSKKYRASAPASFKDLGIP